MLTPSSLHADYGQNTKIRETLNNLILKSPQDWPTGVGLPFVRIQGTNVEWDELKFDVRLLQRVPYEGVSRMRAFALLDLRRCHVGRRFSDAPPLASQRRACAAGTATASCAAASGWSSRVTYAAAALPAALAFDALRCSHAAPPRSSTPPRPAARTSRISSRRSATASRRCVLPAPRLRYAPAHPPASSLSLHSSVRRPATSCAAALSRTNANRSILLTLASAHYPQDALYAYLTCTNCTRHALPEPTRSHTLTPPCCSQTTSATTSRRASARASRSARRCSTRSPCTRSRRRRAWASTRPSRRARRAWRATKSHPTQVAAFQTRPIRKS